MKNLIALILAMLAPVVIAGGDRPPDIYATFKSRYFLHFQRPGLREHAGVDFGAPYGTPVIASAPGVVKWVVPFFDCGALVSIQHIESEVFTENKFTIYCHLATILVKTGQVVARGERIGTNGAEGNSPREYPHVHFEVNSDGVSHASGAWVATSIDPLTMIVGCFDPKATYPDNKDRLVLTYPLPCR
jgi:murein DD-endopeptidase MepM/ murein hydrolase activator NlpD